MILTVPKYMFYNGVCSPDSIYGIPTYVYDFPLDVDKVERA